MGETKSNVISKYKSVQNKLPNSYVKQKRLSSHSRKNEKDLQLCKTMKST
uniref:Uncharacterized protein n=1 Tax=Nelumbo nucifera TaxID=4432 RepID=A0A822ZHN3_NELNU|nr:TPA_asm: hypothetical protein HUJ06_001401 [Nelumbo nucifera]